jgi:hypothetical protein
MATQTSAETNELTGEQELNKPEEFSYHEVVHTAHILETTFNGFIIESVAVKANPELLAAATKASEALNEFYQIAGKIRYDLFE